jgi:hypothetical protein
MKNITKIIIVVALFFFITPNKLPRRTYKSLYGIKHSLDEDPKP